MLCSVSCGDKDFLCLLLRQDQFGSGGIRIIVGQIAKCIRNSVEQRGIHFLIYIFLHAMRHKCVKTT